MERKIKNYEELAVTDMRREALEVAEAGLQAIDTERIVQGLLKYENGIITIGNETIKREAVGNIIVDGIGKCALEAMHTIEDILGEEITRGVALYSVGESRLKRIESMKGTHPLPSEQNIEGAKKIVEGLRELKENDLVIFVVSGGGSTLLCLPEDMGCHEEADMVEALTRKGATIQEINIVRKHLSLARGGYLAQYAYPARVVTLVFSDVMGDDIQFIASGPMIKDTTTIEEAEMILAKYDVLKTCGIDKCGIVETPKDDKYFKNVTHILAVSNDTALRAMEIKAKELGWNPTVRPASLKGEAKEMAKRILGELHAAPSHTMILYGGETTVTVVGRGRGGRNLELALAGINEVGADELLMPVATDGRDNGEFAGAICDTITKTKIAGQGMKIEEFLVENNEYPFFEHMGNYVITGDTKSNVSDIAIGCKE